MGTTEEHTAQIRDIVARHGRLPVDPASLGDADDLFAMGMTSHASVSVMLALEEAFDIEFPEPMLRKSTFASIAAMYDAIAQLAPGIEVPA